MTRAELLKRLNAIARTEQADTEAVREAIRRLTPKRDPLAKTAHCHDDGRDCLDPNCPDHNPVK
jgi:hypothetical protein